MNYEYLLDTNILSDFRRSRLQLAWRKQALAFSLGIDPQAQKIKKRLYELSPDN